MNLTVLAFLAVLGPVSALQASRLFQATLTGPQDDTNSTITDLAPVC